LPRTRSAAAPRTSEFVVAGRSAFPRRRRSARTAASASSWTRCRIGASIGYLLAAG
jgi:hypothetical protein